MPFSFCLNSLMIFSLFTQLCTVCTIKTQLYIDVIIKWIQLIDMEIKKTLMTEEKKERTHAHTIASKMPLNFIFLPSHQILNESIVTRTNTHKLKHVRTHARTLALSNRFSKPPPNKDLCVKRNLNVNNDFFFKKNESIFRAHSLLLARALVEI